MADTTKIEWCDSTWNPLVGCSWASAGCNRCWAERTVSRFCSSYTPWMDAINPTTHAWSGQIVSITGQLDKPLKWKNHRRIFALGMTDFCHRNTSTEQLKSVGRVMIEAHQHTYILLTKRPERLRNVVKCMFDMSIAPRHVWIGVSVEDQYTTERINDLMQANVTDTPFVSCEPLINPVSLGPLAGVLEWVIAGCEQGPNRCIPRLEWFREIRDECIDRNVPFFLKQLSYIDDDNHTISSQYLDGNRWLQFPRRP